MPDGRAPRFCRSPATHPFAVISVSSMAAAAVLMDAPPPHEDPRPFVSVGEWLCVMALPRPEILARDLDQGLLLLEDFGDARLREHLDATPQDEAQLYEPCCRSARRVASAAGAGRDSPPYDRAVYQREAGLLTEWFAPAAGLDMDVDAYVAAWDAVLPIAETDAAPPVTVLRDYHAENIMLLPDANTATALACSTFRTRWLAIRPTTSSRCCRMRAATWSPDLERAMLARYVSAAPVSADFEAAYAVLGAQRNAKIIGIFTRLWKRDGKPRYLAIPAAHVGPARA
jgi:aminoglycoside/choline kinase family phosphotransferase